MCARAFRHSSPPSKLLLAQPSKATKREASVWLLPSKDVEARTVYGHLTVAHMAVLTTIQSRGGGENYAEDRNLVKDTCNPCLPLAFG